MMGLGCAMLSRNAPVSSSGCFRERRPGASVVVDLQEIPFVDCRPTFSSHIFNVNTFRGAISHSIQEHLATFFKLLANHAKSGEQLDLADAFFRFTLDSFVKMG